MHRYGLKASTLVELLVTMIVSGILLLAVYDGLGLLCRSFSKNAGIFDCGRLDWLEHYEILEFRSDSVGKQGSSYVFYASGEPLDTLVEHGL